MDSYQLGNALAFGTLLQRHSGRVLGYLRKRLSHSPQSDVLAEDLLQEVFFKLHRSRKLYDRNLKFLPWLFSIARSVLLDHLKKPHLEMLSNFDQLPEVAVEVRGEDFVPIPGEQNPGLQQAIRSLPPQQQEALHLRFGDDLKFEEIARRLAIQPPNARQLVHRGLTALRKRLKGKGLQS